MARTTRDRTRSAKKSTANLETLPLEVLVTLDTVFARGSFSAAALALGLTQPSISAQVARAESAAGEPLFERLGRGIRATPAGEAVRGVAREAGRLRASFATALAESRGLVRGRVAFAASTTIAGYVIPRALSHFRREYPGIDVSVAVGNTAQVAQAVRREEAEFGLVEGPLEHRDLEAREFVRDELLVVVAPRDVWSRLRRIKPERLAERPWISREPGSGTREVAERALAARGVVLRPAVELGHSEGIKQLVREGAGWAILSRHVVAEELARKQLAALRVNGVAFERAFSRVLRRHAPRGLAVRACLAALGAGLTTA